MSSVKIIRKKGRNCLLSFIRIYDKKKYDECEKLGFEIVEKNELIHFVDQNNGFIYRDNNKTYKVVYVKQKDLFGSFKYYFTIKRKYFFFNNRFKESFIIYSKHSAGVVAYFVTR